MLQASRRRKVRMKKFFPVLIFILIILINKVFPQNVQYYLNQGISNFNEERYFDAIGFFRDAINLNPYDAKAYYYLGNVYYVLKDYKTSLEEGLTGLKYANTDVDLLLLVANSYRELQEYAKAEEFYKKTLKLYPSDPEVLRNVGEFYLKINRLSIAYDYLKKAERVQKDSYKIAISLANYFHKKNDIQNAENYYKKAFNLNPYNRDVFVIFAKFYLEQNRILEAAKILESGEELFPNFFSGISLLSECYIRLGKAEKKYYQKAIEKLEWLIKNSPKIDEKSLSMLYYKLSLSYENFDINKAIENYEKAIKLDPNNELIRYSFETFLIEKLEVNNPKREKFALYHLEKAKNYKNEGELNLYFLHLKRAITINPFFIEARRLLIDFYESRSDFYNAYEELKKLDKIYNSSYEIKDKLEKYEWKLKKQKMKFEKSEYLEYQGVFLVDSEYYNFSEVFSKIFSYYSQYFEKFKFSTLEFRKKQGINYILEFLSQNNKTFFIISTLDENQKLILFSIYEKTGKIIDKIYFNFKEGELEQVILKFLQKMNSDYPSICKTEKLPGEKEIKIKAGILDGIKEGDEVSTFDIENLSIKKKDSVKIINAGYYLSTGEIVDKKKLPEIGNYAVKAEYLTTKYLTKWKRILGY
jgi:tetratricopeptide (TPR) repeat protein